ncbi:MAG: undecaprenyl-diphosphatase UppP [Anaerolineaceae bacterium]
MSIFQAFVLGIIQGLTEFLPISSSAHLVIAPFLLQWELSEELVFSFDVLVQLGTLLAVIVFFWKDLIDILTGFFQGLFSGKPFSDSRAKMGWLLILATIPAGIFGLLVKDAVESAFHDVKATAICLIITAVILILAEKLGRKTRNLDSLTWVDALWIGVAQAISIFPGISRSGSSISGGLFRGLDRPAAARFSFLMSIPIMLAAGGLSVLDLFDLPNLSAYLPVIAVGFVSAAVVGYIAIRWFISYISNHSLILFAWYCLVLGGVTLIAAFL